MIFTLTGKLNDLKGTVKCKKADIWRSYPGRAAVLAKIVDVNCIGEFSWKTSTTAKVVYFQAVFNGDTDYSSSKSNLIQTGVG